MFISLFIKIQDSDKIRPLLGQQVVCYGTVFPIIPDETILCLRSSGDPSYVEAGDVL